MNVVVLNKVSELGGIKSLYIEKNGSFEATDDVVYVKYAGGEEQVLQDAVGIMNLSQLCRAFRLMGPDVKVEHICADPDNVIRMRAGRKKLDFGVSDKNIVAKNCYIAKDKHILDKTSEITSKLVLTISSADRKEIKDALMLVNSEDAYFEQNKEGFFFVAGKDGATSCEMRLSDGNFAEIGKFFVKFPKDCLEDLFNITSESAEFVFHTVKNGPAPLQINDGAMTYVLIPYKK